MSEGDFWKSVRDASREVGGWQDWEKNYFISVPPTTIWDEEALAMSETSDIKALIVEAIKGGYSDAITDAVNARLIEVNYRLRKRIRGLRTANRQQAKHIERLHGVIGDWRLWVTVGPPKAMP